MSKPSVSLTYAYDGALTTGTTWSGTVGGSVTHAFDNNFRLTSQTVSGDSIGFQYDNDSLLTAAGALTLTRNPQNGLITGTTLGNVTDSFAYNSFGELASYGAAFSGSEIFRAQYIRDILGRVTQKTETIGGTTDAFDFSYDVAGRLSEVRKNGTIIGTYTYDANSNRLTGPSGATTYTYDDQDRLLTQGSAPGTQSFAYNAHGQLTARTNGPSVTAYEYDERGGLLKVTLPAGTEIEYVTDGQNRRIGRKVNGLLVQKFLYADGLKPIGELDDNDNLVSRFIYSTGVNVPAYMVKGGVRYRIITDDLGSPRLVLDVSSGNIAQRMDYDEFGNVVNDTNAGFQPFGFAGGLYDPDTKLIRYGLRDYAPETGRWTAKDPGGFASGPNLYIYADNDPVNLVDPLGNDPVDPFESTGVGQPPTADTGGYSSDVAAARAERARVQSYVQAEQRNFFKTPDARIYNGSIFPSNTIPFGTNQVSGEIGNGFTANLTRTGPLPRCTAGSAGNAALLGFQIFLFTEKGQEFEEWLNRPETVRSIVIGVWYPVLNPPIRGAILEGIRKGLEP